jgi:transcriptional regulator with XRE-family HTH domain
MDKVERAKELRDEYESALDEADRRRAAYHREVLKLHRSGMSLREIAEELGISHQRVHQIVGAEEPETQKRRRLAGGAAVIVVLLLIAGFAITQRFDRERSIAFVGPGPFWSQQPISIPRTCWLVSPGLPVERVPAVLPKPPGPFSPPGPYFAPMPPGSAVACSVQPSGTAGPSGPDGKGARSGHAAHTGGAHPRAD